MNPAPHVVNKRPDFTAVTESPGTGATREQLSILYTRYDLAARYSQGKKVLEVACGAGVGLGLLAGAASEVTGGDVEDANWRLAAETYRNRPSIRVQQLDAQALPFADGTFDVVILFEAIYYLAQPHVFLDEARRVLRRGGVLLISSVNSLWPGFHPSVYSRKYYSVPELRELLLQHGWSAKIFVAFCDQPDGVGQSGVRLIRRAANAMHLIPRTMKGKALLKRLFYGRLTTIPHELLAGMARAEPLVDVEGCSETNLYKMIYAIAQEKG
jgi:SAM-dependent methyltransferase